MEKSLTLTVRFIFRKRYLILLLVLALAFPSCDRIKDVPLGTITVVIDGDEKSFSNEAKAEWITVEGGYGLKISGHKGDTGTSNEVFITIASPHQIGTGTYSNAVSGNAVVINYNVFIYLFWDEYVSSSASVTISELDASHVKGTFSGTVVSGENSKVFSKGVFNVSF